MPAGPRLLKSYDLTPYPADTRANFQVQVAARLATGTWSVQGDPAIGALFVFLMDDASAGAVLALDAAFAEYEAG